MNASHDHGYQLQFRPLTEASRAVSFPCDAAGRVNIDALSERARMNYFYARTVIGREFAIPAVTASTLH
jgi:hypothetical protein